MKLARSERTKLIANACDRASTGCLTVGIAAPLAGNFYGFNPLSGWHWAVVCSAWLFAASLLHAAAYFTLGRLQE
jgi:hypothetical protein